MPTLIYNKPIKTQTWMINKIRDLFSLCMFGKEKSRIWEAN